ncbi:MAG TPA: tRNA (N(6)-L-threonylcarbamoyladenosine(37)-C(2))-methylthiotransferase MtaB [Terriglobales bacterium]|nr:tRNA (N(6)-L-threonylcarbamoyladenosine(37)-C(2))-methylthiotransferase MtaB [Terriglobales bacterium]
MKFFVQNFGCRATQADGAAIERSLAQRGLLAATSANEAELVVLNTCTVTAAADADARAAIRRIHRENPGCRILVTGCYAQRAPEEIASLEGVSGVIGNSHKHQIANMAVPAGKDFFPLLALTPQAASGAEALHSPVLVGDIFAHTDLLAAPVFEATAEVAVATGSTRTRPNLKVQDGCDNRCSFCIIPSVRGHSRSLPLADVLHEVEGLVRAGYREMVISGINLGRWGHDLTPQRRFEELLHTILECTAIEKIRISSVEPMDWSSELIDLVTSHPRIARHAHVPLQSGSDHVLRIMHRKYRPWHYAERVSKVRERSQVAAIGADVMVGFPGETDELFEENRQFIAALPFTYLHIFTFSARPGTPAATMPDQVPPQVARERHKILRDLIAEKNHAFRQSFIGTRLNAITLSTPSEVENSTEALTDNFLKLQLEGKHLSNKWIEAKITTLTEDGLRGAIQSPIFD